MNFFLCWPSLGEHLFDRLLWSIFQSSIHKHYKLHFFIYARAPNTSDFLSNHIISELIICLLSKGREWEDHDQILEISKVSDQNGDRVSKNGKSCHIYNKRVKGVLAKYEKYGICLHISLTNTLTCRTCSVHVKK